MNKLTLVPFVLVLAVPVAAQNQDGFSNPLQGLTQHECLADNFECFQLFNGCEPIDVVVGVSDNEIGLTEERVRTTIESRLRAARIYDSTSGPFLRVLVDTLPEGPAFTTTFEFRKWLFDDLIGVTMLAGSWSSGRFGTVSGSGDASFIMQGLTENIDEFINDYLRVNEPACD